MKLYEEMERDEKRKTLTIMQRNKMLEKYTHFLMGLADTAHNF